MRHAMVGRASDAHTRRDKLVARFAKLIVRLADLQAEVVQPEPAASRQRRCAAYLDQ